MLSKAHNEFKCYIPAGHSFRLGVFVSINLNGKFSTKLELPFLTMKYCLFTVLKNKRVMIWYASDTYQ